MRLALAAVLAALALGLPLWIAAVGSVSSEAALFEGVTLWPREPTLAHYRALFAERAFWEPLRHSLVVAASTTVLCLLLGSACAWSFARLRFRGKAFWLGALLAVGMFPQISLVAPLYLGLRALGWIDSYPALVLPYLTFAMPLAVWLLAGFFRELPVELEEAAWIDGAGRLRAFREVVLPLAAPALVATAIVTFLFCWNEFLFALSFTLERQTVPVAVALFRGQYRVPWGEILAASLVATLPVMALVLAVQRRMVRGLTAGAVKG